MTFHALPSPTTTFHQVLQAPRKAFAAPFHREKLLGGLGLHLVIGPCVTVRARKGSPRKGSPRQCSPRRPFSPLTTGPPESLWLHASAHHGAPPSHFPQVLPVYHLVHMVLSEPGHGAYCSIFGGCMQ